MQQSSLNKMIDAVIFKHRAVVLILFALITVAMGYFASQLKVDASFEKNIPLEHPYMKETYLKHEEEFGGANRILIALEDSSGDIFNAQFFRALSLATERVNAISSVNQPQVQSLFTPNTRYLEVVEDGLEGGPVIPASFDFDNPESIDKVRKNALKGGFVGRLVSNDFSSAMVSAQLFAIDPTTKEETDFISVAKQLEQIRVDIEQQFPNVKLHIIGFSKMIGDISDGAQGVLMFFGAAFLITALLVYFYSHSIQLSILPLLTSVVAVVWQLGLLTLFGFGIDPMSILVPFLVFAIGVSHGVQMINAVGKNVSGGATALDASCAACCRLFIPGMVALVSDTIGFLTLLLIEIDIIKELAVTASIGVAVIILTNLILLPVLLSFARFDKKFSDKVTRGAARQSILWRKLASFAEPRNAKITIIVAAVLAIGGSYLANDMKIGDLHEGAPSLRPDSVYNKDTAFITERFSIGTDVISVMAETKIDGCTDYQVMQTIDDFQWHLQNLSGVQSTISITSISKMLNAGFFEGNLKWKVLPRETATLAQSIRYVETSAGLFDKDCQFMPIMVFTVDHKAETIEEVINAVKEYREANPSDLVEFKLAMGPVGVMAATNEAVAAAQYPMLIGVYIAVIFLCLISFRSIRSTLCIIIPLALVSVLAQALMTWLEIGLTVATLPVIALGVGIGVDYGIYIFSRMLDFIRAGDSIHEAFYKTLNLTGNAVFFTGITLAIGVSTWIFSALQFQADMGILLTFMFLFNMLGAVILLPALASLFYRR
ncbi:efflux RND transporter permease subunit [Pleionea litopenaei]|uniref:MMPL family transporter n=1 Tax=Pleionea litopenaei TaxID=3070815 RepID=A0AA51X6M9_9GAMM|nr:MMPL family transporter [Pleionea sp. HL-JVS1]WMS87457.1 MMPL family transporter [Pleionea sp. HL-JVS1]